MVDRNKETIKKANALVADGNIEEFVLLCSEDVKWTLLVDKPMVINGREGIREFMTPKDKDSADKPEFTVDKIIGENDTVVSVGEMTMKEKDGSSQKYTFCDIYTFKSDLIGEFLTLMSKMDADATKKNSAAA